MTEVVLKELDATHKNCWEVSFYGPVFTYICLLFIGLGSTTPFSFQSFFEAASLMSQITHRHLLLVYGVSVHGVKSKFKRSCTIILTVSVSQLLVHHLSDVLLCVD